MTFCTTYLCAIFICLQYNYRYMIYVIFQKPVKDYLYLLLIINIFPTRSKYQIKHYYTKRYYLFKTLKLSFCCNNMIIVIQQLDNFKRQICPMRY